MLKNNLQPVDIASLKSGDEVILIGGAYARQTAIVEKILSDERWWNVKVKTNDGKSHNYNHGNLAYPPSPQLRPIDLATIKEGMPVVIQSEGSEWDKWNGQVFAVANGNVHVDFGGELIYPFPASIVFHAPEQFKKQDLQQVDFQTITEGDEVIIVCAYDPFNNERGKIDEWSFANRSINVLLYCNNQVIPFDSRWVFYAPETQPSPLTEKPFEVGDEEWIPAIGEMATPHQYETYGGLDGQIQKIEFRLHDSTIYQLYFADGKAAWFERESFSKSKFKDEPTASALKRVPIKQEQPELVELKDAVAFVKSAYGDKAKYFIDCFSKQANQYHLPKSASRPFPVGRMIDRAILFLEYSGEKEAAELLRGNDWMDWEKPEKVKSLVQSPLSDHEMQHSFTPGQWDN